MPKDATATAGYGNRLRSARMHRGWKQEYLAARLGVSQGTVAKWESGARQPSVSMRHRLRDLLWRGNTLQRQAAFVQRDPGLSALSANTSKLLAVSPGLQAMAPEIAPGTYASNVTDDLTQRMIDRVMAQGCAGQDIIGVSYFIEEKSLLFHVSWQPILDDDSLHFLVLQRPMLSRPDCLEPEIMLVDDLSESDSFLRWPEWN